MKYGGKVIFQQLLDDRDYAANYSGDHDRISIVTRARNQFELHTLFKL